MSSPVDAPDAVVSLASHEWERLPAAALAARRHPSAIVLLTLPQPITKYNCQHCGTRVDTLEALGIARSRIQIVQIAGSGTYGEATGVREYARQRGLSRLLIVTSPYHTRRSLAIFRSVLKHTPTEVGVEPASATSPARPDAWWRAPYDRWYVRYEWAAMFYYALRYRVGFS